MRGYLLLSLVLLLSSCAKVWHKADVEYTRIEIDGIQNSGHPIEALITPYKIQIDEKMDIVIGINEIELTKERVESNIGNWMADIILDEASRLTTMKVDFAIQNYGGIRLPSISAGPITIRTIYELMPFDNAMVILEADGPTTKMLLDRIATYGGWPISRSVKFEIKDGHAENIYINNLPFDIEKTYRIALPDYVANGGDGTDFLADLPREDFALLLRDAIINNIKRDAEEGIHQSAVKEGRIIIAN